jgi:branched-chain amino acid transport system permease protein
VEIIQALVSGIALGAVYALVAVGLTIVLGVMDIVNFAHGDFLTLALYATFLASIGLHLDPLAALPLTAAVLALLAAGVYYVLIRRVLRGPALSQLILTFGLLVLIRGAVQLAFTSNTVAVAKPLAGTARVAVHGIALGGAELAAALGAIVAVTAIWAFLSRTEAGTALAAVAENRDAAQLMGINPHRMYLLAWVLAGASIGVAGALLANYYPITPDAGATFGLVAFVTVTLGGFGSLKGAALAGVLLGVVQDVVGLYIPAYGFAAIFVLYLGVVLVRPQGLFGTR